MKPVQRHVVRAVLLDPSDRVLLLHLDRDRDPLGKGYWYPPGGGIRRGETPEAALSRELREEAGIADVEIGERLVHLNGVRFALGSRTFVQDEWHILARVTEPALGAGRAGDLEADAVDAHRWWTLAELASTDEVIYPTGLVTTLVSVLAAEPPKDPPPAEAIDSHRRS